MNPRPPLAVAALTALALVAAACASKAGAPHEAPSGVATTGATVSATPSSTVTATATAADAAPAGQASPAGEPPGSTATSVPAGAGGPSVTIDAVGDVSLARELVDRMQAGGADYPYALIAPLLTGDIGFANLEGALTSRGDPWPKAYNFRTPASFTPGLRRAFDAVTVANNHTMDYGTIGLQDTMLALDANGIARAGAGNSAAEAWAPAIVSANSLRVAFVACVLTPTEGTGFAIATWTAGAASAGLAVCDTGALTAAVQAARRQADFVVVAVHAGDEYRTAPNAAQRTMADAALAAGADAYIGAHAHVVQPVERRGNQLIAWGLGNFIFDLDNVDLANIPQPRVAPVLHLTLTKGAGVTSWRADAVVLDADEDRPRPATPDEAAVLHEMLGG